MQNWRPPHKQERQTNETARAAAHSSSRLLEYDELAARLARRARGQRGLPAGYLVVVYGGAGSSSNNGGDVQATRMFTASARRCWRPNRLA